ncbi:MAG TPA: aminodeoxychorismate lyase [Microbacteriaceae bacterium]|nr:aminodeoxychorismate lyase [Microbacteriaceae bacterium]
MPDHHPESLVLLNRPSAHAPAHEPNAPAFRLVDPAALVISALDQGATRGDGVFETISVGHGSPQSLEHHLVRFERSAASLDLPAPDLDAYRAAIAAAIGALPIAAEAWAKAVLTRGVEGGESPTGWVYATHSPDFAEVRRTGVRVVVLDRGLRHDVEQTSPWLLAGAKTLSYAVNRATQREAQRRGADDVIFVSSDGYILEGPTSTVLYRLDGRIWTPGTGLGILDGTTQTALFELFASLGIETGYRLAGPEELERADAVWLVSSVRHAAPVREIDGRPVPVDAELTARMNEFLEHLQE